MTKFEQLWNTSVEVQFSASWKNGTGYFDHAVSGPHAMTFALGQQAKFADDKGRRGVFLGTPYGAAVIFDRYTAAEGGVQVCNLPRSLERELPDELDMTSRVTDEKLVAFCDWLETLKK